jgi:hypothetical protein
VVLAAKDALAQVLAACAKTAEVVVAIGGGTGGEIALQVLRALPFTLTVTPIDAHISAPEITGEIMTKLAALSA